MVKHLTREEKVQIRQMRIEGIPVAEVARRMGCHLTTVALHGRRDVPPAKPDPMSFAPPGRLHLSEREEIFAGVVRDETFTQIAATIGCAVSTVSREVQRNGGRRLYRASDAQRRAHARSRRPKRRKLSEPRLRQEVTNALERWWSPEQVSRRLRIDYPDDPMMRVSHETIYQSIFVQGRGQLQRELATCLRSRRTQRKHHGGTQSTWGQIQNMVNISQRPKEVADRAVPGDWEGDLIIGQNSASAVATLVERTTGFLLLSALPGGKTADQVDRALRAQVTKLPEALMRSITWDSHNDLVLGRELGLTRRGIGFVPYLGFVDPAPARGRAPAGRTNVT